MEYRFYQAGLDGGPSASTLKVADCADDTAALLKAIELSSVSGSTEVWKGHSLVCRVPASMRPRKSAHVPHGNTHASEIALRELEALAVEWVERQRRRLKADDVAKEATRQVT